MNAYMYGTRARKESWEAVDIMLKEAIDSSGVFNTILLESHQDFKEFNATSTIVSPSMAPEFLMSLNPPIMFGGEGIVIMSAEAMEKPMGLQRVLGKKYVEEYFIGDVYHDIFNHDPKYKSMMYRSKPLHNGVQLEKLSILSAPGKSLVNVRVDNADASLVTAYDNCAVILSGKRVGFTINPEQWIHKTVPYDIEKILISSILWASYGSTNEDCSDRLPAPSSFTGIVSVIDITANTADFAWTGAAKGCEEIGLTFLYWEMQMAYAPYSEEDFVEIPGCMSLTDKSIVSCTSTELLQNGLIQFRLRERCSIELGSSFGRYYLL